MAPNWNPPSCPPTGKFLNKAWYIHSMKYYPAVIGMNYWYTQKLGKSPRNHAEGEKEINPKGYILYDSIYTTFLRWQNFRNVEQRSSFQGASEEWQEGGECCHERVAWGILVVKLQCFDCGYGCMGAKSLSCVQLWTVARQAPLSMGFSGKNTGVGCRALLQRIFPTRGSNSGL